MVLENKQYVKMVLTILSDNEFYGILDPTDAFKGELEEILIMAFDQKLISKEECHYMPPKDPQIPTFYALPKIHKGLSPLKGCPVVAGINSITQNVGIYLDQVLRNFVTALPSYVHDTSE